MSDHCPTCGTEAAVKEADGGGPSAFCPKCAKYWTRPQESAIVNIISLGAGVQSSAMALMCAKGELPYKVTCAIFADTQAEPASVYKWLDWLEKQLPFPVHRVTKGSLVDETLRVRISGKNGLPYMKNYIPSFGVGEDGSHGMMPRKCTTDFKIIPIMQAYRKHANIRRGEKAHRVNSLIGISLDEIRRMKPSLEPWAANVYPLVDARISRTGCLEWMKRNGYPTPPRSACVFCPYHSNAEWHRLKTDEPEEFQKAVEFERKLWDSAKGRGITSKEYLHATRQPLDQVQFADPNQLDLFGKHWNNECEGMCGV